MINKITLTYIPITIPLQKYENMEKT